MQKKRDILAYTMSLGIVLVSIFAIMQSNLTYVNSKEVTIVDGDELKVFLTDSETVIDALVDSEVQFGNFDELSVELDEYIYDGIEIEITRAQSVVINDGGNRFYVMTTEKNVDDVLYAHDIEVGLADELTVTKTASTPEGETPIALNSPLVADGVQIELTRFEYELASELVEEVLKTEYIYTDDLLDGDREVREEGAPRITEHVTAVTFRNGEEYSSEEVENNVVEEGTRRVVAIGTGSPEPEPEPEPEPIPPRPAPSNNATSVTTVADAPSNNDALDSFTASVTAYLADCPGCSGRVACNGRDVRQNINFNDSTFGSVRIVAAGHQFPCGTIMDIEGIGLAVVLDRGSSVTGNVLDVLMGSGSNPWQFGRQSLYTQVVRLGW